MRCPVRGLLLGHEVVHGVLTSLDVDLLAPSKAKDVRVEPFRGVCHGLALGVVLCVELVVARGVVHHLRRKGWGVLLGCEREWELRLFALLAPTRAGCFCVSTAMRLTEMPEESLPQLAYLPCASFQPFWFAWPLFFEVRTEMAFWCIPTQKYDTREAILGWSNLCFTYCRKGVC